MVSYSDSPGFIKKYKKEKYCTVFTAQCCFSIARIYILCIQMLTLRVQLGESVLISLPTYLTSIHVRQEFKLYETSLLLP